MQRFIHIFIVMLYLLFVCSLYSSGQKSVLIIDSVNCYGGSDGGFKILIPDTTQVFVAYFYKNTPSGIPLEAKLLNDTTYFGVNGLAAGKYFIEIKSDKGYSLTQHIEVAQPDKLETGIITVDKKLSAPDAQDAKLKALPKGGTLPYNYLWNIKGDAKQSQIVINIGQGTYTCTINDANNCGPVKATILFNNHVMPNIVEE